MFFYSSKHQVLKAGQSIARTAAWSVGLVAVASSLFASWDGSVPVLILSKLLAFGIALEIALQLISHIRLSGKMFDKLQLMLPHCPAESRVICAGLQMGCSLRYRDYFWVQSAFVQKSVLSKKATRPL